MMAWFNRTKLGAHQAAAGDRAPALGAMLLWYGRVSGKRRGAHSPSIPPPCCCRSGRRVLKNNEIARFGEYRTASLILQAWDALERKELLW